MHKLRDTAIPAPRSLPFGTSVTSALSHWSLLLLVVLQRVTQRKGSRKISRIGFQPLAIREKQKQNLIFCCCFGFFLPSFCKRDSSSLLLLYILTAPAGNLLGLFKTGLKTQFSALAQLKRITSALFSASQLFNPESHVTSNYEYDFHVPLGPKFHPSKSSHSAAGETCQKHWSSSTESALGEIKLSQTELSQCQASFPLLFIVVDTPHPSFLSPLVWKPGMAREREKKKKSPLNSKYFWDSSSLH